jgi:hypothetical protein
VEVLEATEAMEETRGMVIIPSQNLNQLGMPAEGKDMPHHLLSKPMDNLKQDTLHHQHSNNRAMVSRVAMVKHMEDNNHNNLVIRILTQMAVLIMLMR